MNMAPAPEILVFISVAQDPELSLSMAPDSVRLHTLNF